MIGKLKGILDTCGSDWILLDVNGVCYEITCSSRTLAALPPVGEPVTLSIETHVREDMIRLFGFANEHERSWFRLLQSVQGVGAKVALAILGTLSVTDIANAIAMQDKAMVARAPGVGPKVAQRIVSELKDKVPTLSLSGDLASTLHAETVSAPQTSAAAEAVSALTNLGYHASQASAAIATAYKQAGEGAKTEQLIRLGLKELAR